MKRLFIIVLLMTTPVFAGLDAKGGKVINVATPTDLTDAANKQYVDDTSTEASGFNVKDFGATGDGSTDDTTAIDAALAAATSGGTVFFPGGRYLYNTNQPGINNILYDNIRIIGVGGATVLVSNYNYGDSRGSQGFRFFNATSKSGITIENLAFEGYGTLCSLYECSNIKINNVMGSGFLTNASNYLFELGVFLHKCDNISITNSRFVNYGWPVYLSGDDTTKTSDVFISGNFFENDKTTFTFPYPAGVYVYYAHEVIITGNQFKNIYSHISNGNESTGMGYGVYSGDGDCTLLEVVNNNFLMEGNGTKNSCAAYLTTCENIVFANNQVKYSAQSPMVAKFSIDKTDASVIFTGNNIVASLSGSTSILDFVSSSLGSILIANNYIYGATVSNGGQSPALITNNIFERSYHAGISLGAPSDAPQVGTMILDNIIINANNAGIQMEQYCLQTVIRGNKILDANRSNGSGEANPGIRFTTYSFGSIISNNIIKNTVGGSGNMSYGIVNASGATSRIYKDIINDNTIGIGVQPNNYYYHRYFTSSPTNGIYDIAYGDYTRNSQVDGGNALGWYCLYIKEPTLTSGASSASDTITVDSTSGLSPGDIVLLVSDASSVHLDYHDGNKWHKTTIASVTDGTRFVINDSIPAGDGTYESGTAFLKIARFKVGTMVITSDPPATATSTGTAGTITYDSDYFYVAVATDTWKRTALSTWAVVTENVIFAGENVIFAAEQVVYP